jgi:DNA modification methylase
MKTKPPTPESAGSESRSSGFRDRVDRATKERRQRAADSIAAVRPDDEYRLDDPLCLVRVGDCRELLPEILKSYEGKVDLVFADPPFNWKRAYDRWDDDMPEREYLDFTFDWIDLCIKALRPGGSFWINIPDTWAAEITCYMKHRFDRKPPALMSHQNWCVWHYRFGQNATEKFINSKVHALWFVKGGGLHTWNAGEILEMSDRASIYRDARTTSKRDGMPPGLRVPLDVWYGQYWGRVQGNNSERRGYHDNQLPEVYLERVIRCSSNPGDLVLDPFLGSGTTGVVARDLGRRFIGTEFSTDNARSAWARIQHGPARPLGQSKGMSTAIFPARGNTKPLTLETPATLDVHAPGPTDGGDESTDPGEPTATHSKRRRSGNTHGAAAKPARSSVIRRK